MKQQSNATRLFVSRLKSVTPDLAKCAISYIRSACELLTDNIPVNSTYSKADLLNHAFTVMEDLNHLQNVLAAKNVISLKDRLSTLPPSNLTELYNLVLQAAIKSGADIDETSVIVEQYQVLSQLYAAAA